MLKILKTLFNYDKQINEQEIIDKINTSLDQLGKLRNEGLKNLLSLQSVKNEALERERKRLEEKFGADHPRVKIIAAKLFIYAGLIRLVHAKLEEESSDEA